MGAFLISHTCYKSSDIIPNKSLEVLFAVISTLEAQSIPNSPSLQPSQYLLHTCRYLESKLKMALLLVPSCRGYISSPTPVSINFGAQFGVERSAFLFHLIVVTVVNVDFPELFERVTIGQAGRIDRGGASSSSPLSN